MRLYFYYTTISHDREQTISWFPFSDVLEKSVKKAKKI